MITYQPNKTDFIVNTVSAGDQLAPSIASLTGGGFVVAWHTKDGTQDGSGWSIRAQIYDSNRVPVGFEFAINSETKGHQSFPSVSGLAGGGFIVAWTSADPAQDGDHFAIKAQKFFANGLPDGQEVLVNTAGTGAQFDVTTAALRNGGYVVAWTTTDASQDGNAGAIKAQLYSANGAVVGTELQVNTVWAGNQSEPHVAALAHGGFVVTWSSPSGGRSVIKGQVFDAQGLATGSEFLVNTAQTNHQNQSTVTALTGGGFVVAWHTMDATQDGASSAIKAQIFDAQGAAVGAEFLVNTEAANQQVMPDVAALADGGFVIAWHSFDAQQDGDGQAIKAQIYDARGHLNGTEVLVNSETVGNQSAASVTGLSDGGIAFTWVTRDPAQDGDGSAIAARLFDGKMPEPEGVKLTGGEEADALFGGRGNDSLNGNDGNDSLIGAPGADHLAGENGNDRLYGNNGDDTLEGGNGADTLIGHHGEDEIHGGDGLDSLRGGHGFDTLMGDAGHDTIVGQGNADTLYGGDGDDRLYGNRGADILDGGLGDDTLFGNEFGDRLYGGAGHDSLFGGSGVDTLLGGSGEDILDSGSGSDVLTGGGDADTFVFTKRGGIDRVTDWQDGIDRLDFTALGLSLDDFTIFEYKAGAGTALQAVGVLVLLEGVAMASIDALDFL